MYLALRELRFARGRFALVGGVVMLISLLVGLLTALTAGLANQSISAVLGLQADRIVFDGDTADFDSSSIDAAQLTAWQDAVGTDAVSPLAIMPTRVIVDDASEGVAVFATDEVSHVTLAAGTAEALGVSVGDSIEIAGEQVRVDAIGADEWYSHMLVLHAPLDFWHTLAEQQGVDAEATVLLVSGNESAEVAGTIAISPLESLQGLAAFKSEIGSLGLILGMLFVIGALVIGAFFTVWTMQRTGDLAVLRALGASSSKLVLDALSLAGILVVVGVGIGLAGTVGVGALVQDAVPFIVTPLTTLVPAAAMVVLGMAGAAVAVRQVTRVDPLEALGGAR